jgi:hypothetical protein
MGLSISRLAEVRKQLVTQQCSINECLSMIDSLIINEMGGRSSQGAATAESAANIPITKKFPQDVTTKRGKLKFILIKASKWLSAREIKDELRLYGENLPNVDQSLVNLEKVKQIKSRVENGKKKYIF